MMSKAVLKRRSLLQQLGAAAFLATPVFRSVFAEAQAQAPLRLVLFYLPGGVSTVRLGMDETVEDSVWSFDHLLAPLKELQSDILEFRRLTNPTGALVATYEELEGHAGGLRTMFTGSTDHMSYELVPESRAYGQTSSIDQLIANVVGQKTQFGSLQLGVASTTNPVAEAHRCTYNKGVPLKPSEDPQATFARLFPGGVAPAAPSATMAPDPQLTAELLYQHAAGKSRLDQLRAEVMAIKALAGADEQAKLDLHLTTLRELENSLPRAGGAGGTFRGTGCEAPSVGTARGPNVDAPVGDPADYIQHSGPVMQELLYQALNCDLTRIGSFQWLSGGDNNSFPFLGITASHHGLEHSWHESEKAKADYDKIQGWLMLHISNFIKRLKATPEGNGSMLDNTVVFVSSEMWGGHSHHEQIVLVAGKGGGKIRTGRVIDAAGRPHNDLLLSLVNVMGLNVTSVGDPKYCTGPLPIG
jgi:hypothetical protein